MDFRVELGGLITERSAVFRVTFETDDGEFQPATLRDGAFVIEAQPGDLIAILQGPEFLKSIYLLNGTELVKISRSKARRYYRNRDKTPVPPGEASVFDLIDAYKDSKLDLPVL